MSIILSVKRLVVRLCLALSLLFTYSPYLLADNTVEEDCQWIISQPNIDYGAVSRDQIKQLPSGDGELQSRQVVVKLMCSQEIDPVIKIQDLFGSHPSEFQYGQKGELQVSLVSFRVDGQSTTAMVIRHQVDHVTALLKPNDEIRPQSAIRGKRVEMVLNITPKVSATEVTQPMVLTQSGQFSLNVAAFSPSTVRVSSELRAIACIPSVSNNGTVDYHTLHANDLANNAVTVLPAYTLNFTLSCDAATNIAIRARSNRPQSTTNAGSENEIGSALAKTEVLSAGLGKNLPMGLPNVTQAFVAGLGTSNGQKLGGYLLNMPFTQMRLDGQAVTVKYWTPTLPNKATSWNKETDLKGNGGSLFTNTASYFSFSTDTNSVTPMPFKQLNGLLIIQAYITQKQNLNLSSPVHLNGSSTIELYYY
ncbi:MULTISPECIES: DUF1120 domain-containing protein [Providencia]|uniref:DUF1120 domain-containing protein n=1 Tax=Providencia TaxID=586 RepID=UPI0023AADC3D|nr:DUF1120 domain-containing protein [Providencia rettgeri]ELR5149716.1 DUF1120 domain-containing protein [Providencia rettgeri]